MSWNHRLFQEPDTDGEPWLTIREIYYDDKGVPNGYTGDEIAANGNTVEEVRLQLERMLRCLELPILKAEDFTGNKDDL